MAALSNLEYLAPMPKIDRSKTQKIKGSTYPAPFDEPCRERRVERLGAAAGLTQFGTNIVELAPGAWASQRHWHAREDEFVYVLTGELTLVEDEGETKLVSGDCAAWAAGVKNGHHLRNQSESSASFLVVGSRNDEDHGEYSDIDMVFGPNRYSGDKRGGYRRKDGSAY